MRIAVVYPPRRAWPKMEWVAEALRSIGHTVADVHNVKHLAAEDAVSDLVLFEQRCAGLNYADVAEVAGERKGKAIWVQWTFDLMAAELGLPLAEQPSLFRGEVSGLFEPTDTLKMMRLMDLAFVKERSLLNDYAELDVKTRYLDQACPSWIGECRHSERPEFDVCVFGSFHNAATERKGDVRSLIAEGRSVVWAGHPGGDAPPGVSPVSFVPVAQLPELASRAAVTLCVDQRSDLNGYWSDRLWLALGMGACVLRRYSPGLPKAEGRFEVYHTTEELNLKLIGLLTSVEARAELGAAARAYVMRRHTYRHRCLRMLRELAKWRGRETNVAESAVAAA